MKIDSVALDLDVYYAKYPAKRGDSSGSFIEQVGDAIYKKNDFGDLEHIKESEEHLGLEEQDINGNRVFIGKTYWHFGATITLLPDENWAQILSNSFRGIRYIYNTQNRSKSRWSDADLEQFLRWLNRYPKGIIGMPVDMTSLEDEPQLHSCASGSNKPVIHCNDMHSQ